METNQIRPAIVLLSGGLDSATTAAVARERGFGLHALTFDYGQRPVYEVAAARRVGAALGVAEHLVERIDLRVFGGSALTDQIAVPKPGEVARIGGGIPVTYVPARNTIFLAFALAFAEARGASDIFIGVNAIDYSGYPDCRPEFVEAFQRLADVATKAGVNGERFTIHAPLIQMSKADIIREGARLGVDFSLTHSCYDPPKQGVACGQCDSCVLRLEGFRQAGLIDPICYAEFL
ncbi:MAG: 7-cyano-7-deazaguanine synthase QueC [Planctomycetota bacterium]|jgi:7-cyano-7-deazaguanine synthase